MEGLDTLFLSRSSQRLEEPLRWVKALSTGPADTFTLRPSSTATSWSLAGATWQALGMKVEPEVGPEVEPEGPSKRPFGSHQLCEVRSAPCRSYIHAKAWLLVFAGEDVVIIVYV